MIYFEVVIIYFQAQLQPYSAGHTAPVDKADKFLRFTLAAPKG
jgi:hypothetical protein